MDSRRLGEELNQLSRVLFDKAATNWYLAAGIETGAGILGAVLVVAGVSGDFGLLGAIVGLLLLAWAYYLRLRFEDQYGLAETMRRQSVLTEALDWPIERVQASEWRRRAGKRILERFRMRPREEGYYSTAEATGPARLIDMTLESAFWTRHLYGRLRVIVWAVFIGALIVSVLVISIAGFQVTPRGAGVRIATLIYLILPVLLTIDLLGWAIRLGKLFSAIRDIEEDLDRLRSSGTPELPLVLRLGSEYNCQVVSGFPIHPWLFARYHDEIHRLWQMR
jgi:hypothetical protein